MNARTKIRAVALTVCVLFGTACGTDDPPQGWTTGTAADVLGAVEVATTTSTTTTPPPTTTTTTTTLPPALAVNATWGERSDQVRWLQRTLRVTADGVYGPATAAAHTEALDAYGMTTDHVPSPPPTTAPRPAAASGDVPAELLAMVQNLWPEDQWQRALRVAWCESGYRVDAANPTSSARGVFQTLAPWTRAPGTGRTVYGWEYTESGEKLSAAAGLGITEDDARYGWGNVTVAHAIWERSGWSPWNASRHCWARS